MALEIKCAFCGQETLLRREPVYDGLRKSGERLLCSGCGHEFGGEHEVDFVDKPAAPRIFSDADRSTAPRVFNTADDLRNCRHCRHYIVNPFTQRCTKFEREIQSTDCCDDFEKAPEDKKSGDKKDDNPLAKLLG